MECTRSPAKGRWYGGTSTAVLDTFYGFYTPGSRSHKVVGGIPDEVVSGLESLGPVVRRPNTFGAGTGVTGVVGNLAQASAATPNPVVFGNVRVGAVVAPVALTIGNVATAPAEGLNGSIATATAGLTASGAFTSLAAGTNNTTSLLVGMSTATAGSRNGTATITLASDGSFNSGVTTPLTPQTINVTGGVYRLANPTVDTTPIVLAARVGQTPFYAYDRGLLKARVAELRAALPKGIELHYAMKANPMPALVGLMAGLVDGIDVATRPREALARMGVLSDARGLYPRLSARENIVYYGRLQGLTRDAAHARAESLAESLDLKPLLERRTDGFSQGERMKTALARALVHDPANIILDEPTNGLDVLATRALREVLRDEIVEMVGQEPYAQLVALLERPNWTPLPHPAVRKPKS